MTEHIDAHHTTWTERSEQHSMSSSQLYTQMREIKLREVSRQGLSVKSCRREGRLVTRLPGTMP